MIRAPIFPRDWTDFQSAERLGVKIESFVFPKKIDRVVERAVFFFNLAKNLRLGVSFGNSLEMLSIDLVEFLPS